MTTKLNITCVSLKYSLIIIILLSYCSLPCLSTQESSWVDDHHDHNLDKSEGDEQGYKLLFQEWMKEHGRMYESSQEEERRFQIFQKNLKYINERNNGKTSSKSHSHRLGLNKFSDMSHQEFEQVYLHEQKNMPTKFNDVSETKIQRCRGNIPASLDWRKKGVVTSVKNQKNCGSCWAFASVGAMEALNAIRTGKLVTFSAQELVDCDNNSNGCFWGGSYDAFDWVKNNGGISEEAAYPYVARKGTCKANTTKNADNAVKIRSYTHVAASDNALLCAVAKQPIAVSLNATDFQHYASGIYDGDNCVKDSIGTTHIVLIVGYGSKDGEDYWIVKNSWGVKWGMKGYMFIKRNTNLPHGVCSINAWAYYPNN